jgi:uncharacterized protein (UPF0297 family)
VQKEEAVSLLEELSGDEHAWVDFKEDYEIGGIGPKTAEFVRDVASLANTLTDRDDHYIFVGVNDEGDITGITSGREVYRGSGPRHIFSYDESDIQEIVDSNLRPAPKLSWHIFEKDNDKFGVLVITPLKTPPTIITQHINDNNGNRLLHKGLIYIRKGSGKKIAEEEDLERIIQFRIENQRDEILEGIHKAVEIGPEWVDRIGQSLPSDAGVPVQTTEDHAEADVEITQRITREPASTLDEQLNEDIAQWNGRGDDFIDRGALYRYYANPSELNLDKVAIKFLTQSSIKNKLLGIFWLVRESKDTQKEILLGTPDSHHRIERAGEVLLLLNDPDTFENLINASSTNDKYGTLRECKQKMGNTINDRVNYLMNNNGEYVLKHQSWRKDFNPKDMEFDEIMETIPEVGEQLIDLQRLYEQQKAWSRTQKFREALWDLEVALGSEQYS